MDKNSFAPLPPMGWNSYDYYDTTVTEAEVLKNAAYQAAHLLPYGYEYVVVDIQWYAIGAGSRRDEYQYIPFAPVSMDGFGRLLPDESRFPSAAGGAGFAPLAKAIHDMGLKFGIHIMRGIPREAAHRHLPVLGTNATAADVADPASVCRWNPDMYGVRDSAAGQAYYDGIVSLYAQWGVDYIKCDDICNVNNTSPTEENAFAAAHEIRMLHEAILKTGRPIVLSLSPGPALLRQAQFYARYANLWRITDDFWDDWQLLRGMFARCEQWQDHMDAGCYPDCDMLPVGRLGKGFGQERTSRFTPAELRTMLSLWCMVSSPLMLGTHLPSLDEATRAILTNRDVLALRDPKARPRKLRRTEEEAVWYCRDGLQGTDTFALFNLSDAPRRISCDAGEFIGAQPPFRVRDLWTKETTTSAERVLTRTVAPHDVALLQI
ncbi:MAG: glycoside hydrolase family 27 protein [Oscillospiraceae bacterium]|nr:glycoside hydrolase family 27 protein [Oscillospiraceae bacterium]